MTFRKSDTYHTLCSSQTDFIHNCSLIGCHCCRGFYASARKNATDALRRRHNQLRLVKHTGCILGAREHPSSTVLDRGSKPRGRRHGVEPNGSVPLWKRRGVACLAPDREGHDGLYGCVPWDHTGPWTRECKRARFMRTLTRFANRRLRGKR